MAPRNIGSRPSKRNWSAPPKQARERKAGKDGVEARGAQARKTDARRAETKRSEANGSSSPFARDGMDRNPRNSSATRDARTVRLGWGGGPRATPNGAGSAGRAAAAGPGTDPKADAAAVEQAAKTDPVKGAQELNARLEANPDPAYRAQLLEEAKPVIEQIAKDSVEAQGQVNDRAVEELKKAAALAPPAQAALFADAAVKAVESATKVGPREGADAIEKFAGLSDQESFRAGFAAGVGKSVEAIVGALAGRTGDHLTPDTAQALVDSLLRTAKVLGPEAATPLGEALARGLSQLPPEYGTLVGGDPVGQALFGALVGGTDDGTFANAVLGTLAAKDPVRAERAAETFAGKVAEVQREFQEAADSVAALEALAAQYGPVFTPEQMAAGLAAPEYAALYARMEETAAVLAKVLPGVAVLQDNPKVAGLGAEQGGPSVGDVGRSVMADVPRLGRTEAGAKLLAAEAAKLKEGAPNLIDRLLAEGDEEARAAIVDTVIRSVLHGATAEGGDLAGALEQLKALGAKDGVDLGLTPADFDALLEGAPSGNQLDVEAALKLSKTADTLLNQSGRSLPPAAQKLLFGLGTVVAVQGIANNIAAGGPEAQLAAFLGTARLVKSFPGVDQLLGETVAKRAGAVLAGLGVAMDGYAAFQAFFQGGDGYEKVIAGSQFAAGILSFAGAVVAASPATGPGAPILIAAGAIVGAGVVVGELIYGSIDSVKEKRAEDAAQELVQPFLRGAIEKMLLDDGVDSARAAKLAEDQAYRWRDLDNKRQSIVPVIEAAATRLGVTPAELFLKLTYVDNDKLREVVDRAEHIGDNASPTNAGIDELIEYLTEEQIVRGQAYGR